MDGHCVHRSETVPLRALHEYSWFGATPRLIGVVAITDVVSGIVSL